MPPRETRRVDAVLDTGDNQPRILEVDEMQHFNRYRALTLRHYTADARVAYPIEKWIEQSDRKAPARRRRVRQAQATALPSGVWATCLAAFRDILADLLPLEYGWKADAADRRLQILAGLHE